MTSKHIVGASIKQFIACMLSLLSLKLRYHLATVANNVTNSEAFQISMADMTHIPDFTQLQWIHLTMTRLHIQQRVTMCYVTPVVHILLSLFSSLDDFWTFFSLHAAEMGIKEYNKNCCSYLQVFLYSSSTANAPSSLPAKMHVKDLMYQGRSHPIQELCILSMKTESTIWFCAIWFKIAGMVKMTRDLRRLQRPMNDAVQWCTT